MAEWTDAEVAFLRENYRKLSGGRIAEALGRTKGSCQTKAQKLGITQPRSYTPQEIDAVRRLYPDHSAVEVARVIGSTVWRVYNMAFALGLKKSPEYLTAKRREEAKRLRVAGKAHRFKKGRVPENKGTRRPGWHKGRMKETWFKKGQRSRNWRPVGSTRIDRDGYVYTKTAEPNRWAPLHRIIWERENGPVPAGTNIAFRDGDKLNCDISNLEALTDAELMSRNTLHNYPEPVKSAIHALAGFRRRLNSHAKKQTSGSSEHAVRNDGAAAR